MASTLKLPSVMIVKPRGTSHEVAATGLFEGVRDAVYLDSKTGFFNPMGKIEAEVANAGGGTGSYIHLRFTHTNRYWSNSNDGRFIVAVSKEPQEDRTKSTCTMFHPLPAGAAGTFQLIHVQSGHRVVITPSKHFAVSNAAGGDTFEYVDWQTLLKLPRHVAFKGRNGKYLRQLYSDGKPFLQCSSDDPNDQASGYQVIQSVKGRDVNIKSNATGEFWKLSRSPDHSWILVDSRGGFEIDAAFEPFKVGDNTIALKNAGNGRFCRILTNGHRLSASAPTIIREARFEIQELVLDRIIYDVSFMIDRARIYNQRPYLAGKDTITNETDQVATKAVSVTYVEQKSYTFSRGFSGTAGVSTTFRAGLPFIVDDQISANASVNSNLKWDSATTQTTQVTATGSVPIPPKSRVEIKYVGTKGSCSIPYSYTQQDRLSFNGEIVKTQHTDGIYYSDSSYNFDFLIHKVVSL